MKIFSNKVLFAVAIAGVSTFLLGLLIAGYGGEIFGEASAGNDAYSYSLLGHHALVEFLEESGLTVFICRNRMLYSHLGTFPLLLLEPASFSEPFLEADSGQNDSGNPEGDGDGGTQGGFLESIRGRGATLVLALPKWSGTPDNKQPGWIRSKRLLPLSDIENLFKSVLSIQSEGSRQTERARAPKNVQKKLVRRHSGEKSFVAVPFGIDKPTVKIGPETQLLVPRDSIEPLVSCAEGILIGRLAKEDPGFQLYVISDPDLFNTSGLGKGDHAALMYAFFARYLGAEGVLVDETLHGYVVNDSVIMRALSFPVVLLVVHGFLAMGLFAWAVSVRFGKPAEPPPELPPGKRLLIDNTSKLLLFAGDFNFALQRYVEANIDAVSKRFYLDQKVARQDRLPSLVKFTKQQGLPIDLERIMEQTRNKSVRPGAALRLAYRVYSWRKKLLQENK